MDQLFVKFTKSNNETEKERKEKRLRKRKSVKSRNTNSQLRKTSRSYIIEQKHNKLQEALKNKLIEQYGKENVLLEEDFVDIKLLQPNYINFYEVKSNSYASDCMKEALGQILFYSFYDTDIRNKKLIIVGQYPPNNLEEGFIEYLKNKLNVEYEYLELAL